MIVSAKAVGLNSDTHAALALNSPAGTSALPLRLFTIIISEGDEAFVRTRQSLAEIEEVFSSSSESIPLRLKTVLGNIKQSLEGMEGLQVLLAAVQEEEGGAVLYLLAQGSGFRVYLLREGKSSELYGEGEENQLVSGILKGGDRVVLTTQSLVELVGEEFFTLAKLPLENFEDEVAGMLPQTQAYPVAAVVIEKERPQEELLAADASPARQPLPINYRSLSPLPVLRLLSQAAIRLIPRSKRGAALLGMMLMIVLLVGIGLSYKNKKESEAANNFIQKMQDARDNYDKAQSLKDLDVQAAIDSLNQAKLAVDEALKIKPGDNEARQLQQQIDGGSGEILKAFTVGDFPLWLDLDLIKKNLTAARLSLSHGNLLVLDSNQKVAVQVDLQNKSPQILAGEDKLGEAKLASLNGAVAWIFSADKGAVRSEGKEVKAAIKPDNEWEDIVDVYGFAGNLYLLDAGANQIWKYLPTASGYSDKRPYLKEEVKANFSGAQRMQIESSIYILKTNGEILRFTQGSPDYFSISGLDKGIKGPKSFFVSDQTDNLYLLDSGNNRLVVLDKKGIYKSQYTADKFGEFTDLVVDEQGKKVYLLSASKIYSIDLK